MADGVMVESVSSLVETLARHRLLEPAQLDELRKKSWAKGGPRGLVRELVSRNWLTAYQANQLLAGRDSGLVLGPYIVLERLGEGATGQVFKARHVHMRRVVAVKVIRRELLTDAEVVARFYREIQVISKLTHPHVVHAYDAGPIGRTHFLVMEYVEGVDLANRVARHGPLPAVKACDYVRQAALGLQHAHEKGLVHRDIKPSNLILTAASSSRSLTDVDLGSRTLVHGIVKILDLGLARVPRNGEEVHHHTLTLAGKGMMGTPDYLAPEQAIDLRQADIRSDLYSLGCVFFFLLTGQPPFPGGTLAQKLMKHQQAPPPSLEKCRGLPPEIPGIVHRLLAKAPEQRYQTPAELAAVLGPLSGVPDSQTLVMEQPVYAIPAMPRWSVLRSFLHKRRGLVLNCGGGLLLMALLTVFGMLLSRPAPKAAYPSGDSTELEPDDPSSAALRPLLARLRRYREGAEDPEPLRQDFLAVQRDHGGSPQALQAARLLKELPSPLDRWNQRPSPAPVWLPAEVSAVLGETAGRSWSDVTCLAASADGKRVAGGGPDGVVRVWAPETLQETATLPAEGGTIFGLSWSADGRTLAAADSNYHVRVWSFAAATPRLLAKLEHPTAYVNGVALAPDGKWLAATNADGKVHIWDLTGSSGPKQRGTLAGSAGWAHGIALAPDGQTMAVGFANGTAGILDVSGKEPRSLYMLKGHIGPVRSMSFSGNGKTLATLDGRAVRLWAMGDPPRNTVTIAGRGSSVALTPDGKTLAVGIPYPAGIQLWDLTEEPPRKISLLTGHTAAVQTVAFAPDAKSLYSGGVDRTVRRWDLTTTPPREYRATTGPGPFSAFALSPDSQLLVTHGKTDAFVQLWDLKGAAPQPRDRLPLPSTYLATTAFAPDGKYLAVLVGGQLHLWEMGAAKPKEITAPLKSARINSFAFAPNGKMLATTGLPPGIQLWSLGGELRDQGTIPLAGVTAFSLAFTPDGKTLAALGSDRKIRFWNLGSATPEPRSNKFEQGDLPAVIGFAPDGKTLAVVGGKDGQIILHDWSSARPTPPLPLAGRPLCYTRSVAFAPDGRSIAIAGDGTEPLTWWEFPSGRKLRSWSFPGQILGVDFDANGRHLVTVNGNGTVCAIRLGPIPAVGRK